MFLQIRWKSNFGNSLNVLLHQPILCDIFDFTGWRGAMSVDVTIVFTTWNYITETAVFFEYSKICLRPSPDFDHYALVRQDVSAESKTRYDNIEQTIVQECLQNGFVKITESFKGDNQGFDDVDNEIMSNINAKQTEFDEALEDQRASLGETEKAMNEIINDIVGNIRKEIDAERRDRQENQETIISLFENVCTKLRSPDLLDQIGDNNLLEL